MRGYLDGFVLVVPKKKLRAYKRLAQSARKVWRKHGALDYVEAIGNDLSPKYAMVKFPRMIKARKNETVVFSYILFKNRKHRDEVNAKVWRDPFVTSQVGKESEMPFDTKRFAYAGFRVIVGA